MDSTRLQRECASACDSRSPAPGQRSLSSYDSSRIQASTWMTVNACPLPSWLAFESCSVFRSSAYTTY
eukprot:1256266-Rhodomonas_salina.3